MAFLTFRPLGYLENRYWYYSFLLQKIICLTPVEHRKENLFNLAPLSYWEAHYSGTKGIQWEKAIDSLIQTCAAEGLFNPANIIGRGIWIIDGKGVTHYGDKILIDGKKVFPKEITGKRVYELAESLQIGEADPAADFTNIQSHLAKLNFQTPNSALFISGWIVCAMAAGALHWRPHLWLTGKSGSGKSAVMSAIKLLLRTCASHYVGETTEAGIRQDLKNDCRAIIFDEAEPKNPVAIMKITNVLNLLRQASSDETGRIAKGTVTGKGIFYKIRSCGCLGSINPVLSEEPDKNRFLVLEMGTPISKPEYDKWKYVMENTFTEGFQAALHDRISQNIVTLAHNAKIFSTVLAERFMDNRAGDQYGVIMAGAYFLTNVNVISKEKAIDWMHEIIFPCEKAEVNKRSDEKDLWNYMLERMIMFGKDGEKVTFNRPLAELIDVALGNYTPDNYSYKDAEKALSDRGIKTIIDADKQYVAISTNHSAIADLIARSRFGGLEWSGILRRLQGSFVSKKPYRIGIGKEPSKATMIPWGEKCNLEESEVTSKVTCIRN